MSTLETLKEELIKQKVEIEKKGGTVSVNKSNPSPSEITAGIASIELPNLEVATATEQDVFAGKTFFSGNKEIKTGTFVYSVGEMDKYLVEDQTGDNLPRKTISIPEGVVALRKYLFTQFKNPINVVLDNELEYIDIYCFYQANNINITNFNDMQNLKTIGDYAFYESNVSGMDLGNLPDCITNIGVRAFSHCLPLHEGRSIVIKRGVETIGNYAFSNWGRLEYDELNIIRDESSPNLSLGLSVMEQIGFNCDFVLPSCCREIPESFNFRGSFNNIIIHENCTYVGSYSFGAFTDDANSLYRLKTVTFLGTTPPYTIGDRAFALQNMTNGFKIYVPDGSEDSYKNTGSISVLYRDYVYPMSQKE